MPEGWDEAAEEDKELWVQDAVDMLKRDGVVPEGSREAYAVIWDYAKNKKRWNGTTTPNEPVND